MFERFTDNARRVVVLAQEHSRRLQHNYIGTEHLLLGLLAVPDGLAAQVLGQFDMSLSRVEEDVEAAVGRGKKVTMGHIPFTPRAKKILELSLREALSLGHNYIGTEHIVLGILREGDGVAAQIIAARAGDPDQVRSAVLERLSTEEDKLSRRWRRPKVVVSRVDTPETVGEFAATPAADSTLDQAARLAGTNPVGSHHLLLAALGDPDSAAARALSGLGVDLGAAREALRGVDVSGTSDETPEEAGRRRMRLHLTGDELVVHVADPALVDQARRAFEALAGRLERPDTVPGDLADAASLGRVWQAIQASLTDIRQRAARQAGAGPATGGDGDPGDAADGAGPAAQAG
jgi:ATP-dependent Clp protease ATP-binding subunit ClpA